MEKLKLKGRMYLDTFANYIKTDDKGRQYVQVKLVELNQASQYGSTHVLIVDTWKDGKREEKEPTASWLEPMFKNVQPTAQQPQASGSTMTTMPSTADLPEENDGLPF